MILDNKLNINNQVDLARAEGKISKQKAKQLFDSGEINKVQVRTFAGLAFIHSYLFDEIYDFAGEMRDVNIARLQKLLNLIILFSKKLFLSCNY